MNIFDKMITSDPPGIGKALINPSRNILSSKAYKNRYVSITDNKLIQLAQDQNLIVPANFNGVLPVTHHCVSMSLHFLKEYRAKEDIFAAANLTKFGANEEMARTTLVYRKVFEANSASNFSEKQFLLEMRKYVAKTLDLSFSQELTLNYPAEQILPYFQKSLEAGEYLIPLRSHVVSLIKNKEGQLYLYDPNLGTIDLNIEDGKTWFSSFLRSNYVHVNETISLLKVCDNKDSTNTISEFTSDFPEEKPVLTFERGKDRWGVAKFVFRGNTYNFVWDSETNNIYNFDSKALLRMKCTLLIARTLIDSTIRLVYHIAMSAIQMLKLPFVLFNEKKRSILIDKICESVADIFRVPLFTIAAIPLAIYGVIKPYDGRKNYGFCERWLNRQFDASVDYRKKFYTAPCFTPLSFGCLNDSKENTIKALKKYVLKLQSINQMVELWFGWRRRLVKV